MLPLPPMRLRLAVILLSIVGGVVATAVAQPGPAPAGPSDPSGDAGSDAGAADGSGAAGADGSGAAAPVGDGSGDRDLAPAPTAGSGAGSIAAPVTPPVTTDSAAATIVDPAPEPERFVFGSYGRVLAGTDLRGGKAEPVAVVAHGPRIVEKTYLELDFQYRFVAPSGHQVRTVATLAFDDGLFHDTGELDARAGLRNLFAEVDVTDRLSAWAGSRMYRGDDIYLFDYWPLDDQNTVGAGARYQLAGTAAAPWVASAHVGWNRLNDEFQFQEIEVPDPEQGATTVTQLNRQRVIASATFEAPILTGAPAALSVRGKLHAELHALGAGTRRRDDGTLEALPADRGFTIGGELAAFGLADPALRYSRHANLFLRYSRGLAAYDELAPPTAFDMDLKTYPRASELVVGVSGNFDHALGNVMLGVLARRFVDADRNTEDVDDGWEYAIDARPLVKTWRDLYVGGDVSYQARFPRGLNPTSQLASDPAMFQIAPMVVWSPMGPSAYARPQLRLVYRAAHLGEGARDLYAPDDPRHDRAWVHFLGVQAEWWFHSASYR